jgi:hypothetical protein
MMVIIIIPIYHKSRLEYRKINFGLFLREDEKIKAPHVISIRAFIFFYLLKKFKTRLLICSGFSIDIK